MQKLCDFRESARVLAPGSYWKTVPGNTLDLTTEESGCMLIEAAALLNKMNSLISFAPAHEIRNDPSSLPVGLSLLLTGDVRAQQRDYRKDFRFYTDVNGFAPKKAYAYLWPLCGLLQASNEAEGLGIWEFSLVQMTGLIEKYKSYKDPAP